MIPALSMTRMPSAVESSVAVRSDEVDDAQLEGHRGLPIVAEELDSDGDGVDSGRPARGFAQRGHDLGAVVLGHDVGERTHLNEFGIVTQQPGDCPRCRFEEPGGRDQHDHRASVVHE